MTSPPDPPESSSKAGAHAGDGLFDAEESKRRVLLSLHDDESLDPAPGALRRIGAFAGALSVLLLTTYLVPALHPFRPWSPGEDYVPFWNVVGRAVMGEGEELAKEQEELARMRQAAQQTVIPTPAATPTQRVLEPAPVASAALGPVFPPYEKAEPAPDVVIEQPELLEYYFHKLALVDLGREKTVARAGHWGDSILGDDGLTHALRTRLQLRFGDAGHGFHVLGRYNLAYLHRGIRYRDRGGWLSRCEIIFKCESDGHYGYGGVSTRSSAGGTAFFATTKEGLGSAVSRFEFWYAKLPEGGDFQIKVDGEVREIVSTRADTLQDGFTEIVVPDGPHEFEVRSTGNGMGRGYGVVFEREGPGVVWDSIGLIGSFTQRLDYQDPEHIASQIRHRDLDMLVFLMGGNDVQREKMDLYRTMEPYESEYDRVLSKFRAGKPEASCIVMSVTDHGERVGKHGIRTRKIVPKLVASQRKVAQARGCAFYDTFAAMGGEGSIERWYRSKPPLAGGDLGHPTSEGHEVLAGLFYSALMHAYGEYRGKVAGKPLLLEDERRDDSLGANGD